MLQLMKPLVFKKNGKTCSGSLKLKMFLLIVQNSCLQKKLKKKLQNLRKALLSSISNTNKKDPQHQEQVLMMD